LLIVWQLTCLWLINNGGSAEFFAFFAVKRNLSEANALFSHGGICLRNIMMLPVNSASASDCRRLPSRSCWM